MSFPSPITALKLRVSVGSETYEQPIQSASMNGNSVPITAPEIVTAFNTKPIGTVFTPSVVATYSPGSFPSGDMLLVPSVSTYIARTRTPNLYLANLPNKLNTDSPFSLANFVTTNSTGILTYSSSVPSVATVSSSGLVTLVGGGRTTISVSIAASDDGFVAAGPVSRELFITNFSVADLPNNLTTNSTFSLSNFITTNSTGILTYSSSVPIVATVSSSGLVTIVGGGKTTITISLAATNDGYTAGSISKQLSVAGEWIQLGSDIDGMAFEQEIGSSVSLSSNGRTLITGAPSNGYNLSEGKTRIFDLDTTVTPAGWIQRGLDINGTASGQRSGSSVSISSDGNIIAIGGPRTDYGGDGSARVFFWNTAVTPNAWTLRGSAIVITGGNSNNAGRSVSLSSDGNILAIGSPAQDDSVYGENCGKTYVYQWNPSSSNWVQRGSAISGLGTSEHIGWSVSVSSNGNTVATGGQFLGQARVYDWNTNSSDWVQRGSSIDTVMGGSFTNQLTSISLSSDGNTLAVAKEGINTVKVYSWNSNSSKWEQRGTITRPSDSSNFGRSVSLSLNGNRIAIGATGGAGIVRVYDWETTVSPNAWIQYGAAMIGEAVNDQSGASVSLSSDGTTLSIGAPKNTATGWRRGHVRTYIYR